MVRLVTDLEIELPPDWEVRSSDARTGETLAEFQRESPAGTRFVVAIRRPSDVAGYELRFSTIVPGSRQMRHDYPVEEYETRTDAFEGAEAFIEHVSTRIREGSLSSDDPTIEATRAAIRDFSDPRPFSALRRLVRIIRR